MSELDEPASFEELLESVRDYKMDAWERRAQAIDFATGNLMISRPDYDAWMVAKWAAEGYDKRHPTQ